MPAGSASTVLVPSGEAAIVPLGVCLMLTAPGAAAGAAG